ncbi:MAG: M23 family metallopeptidase [bacterium]|nr:M23 family metallopeptidase [bacterium]
MNRFLKTIKIIFILGGLVLVMATQVRVKNTVAEESRDPLTFYVQLEEDYIVNALADFAMGASQLYTSLLDDGSSPIPPGPPPPPIGFFSLPMNNAVLTSKWAIQRTATYCHDGVDYGLHGNPTGAPIYSIGPGKLVGTGYETNYGDWVEIEHTLPDNTKLASFYAHLDSISSEISTAAPGADIPGQTLIGGMGNSGAGGGAHAHLHFALLLTPEIPYSVILLSHTVNPLCYLPPPAYNYSEGSPVYCTAPADQLACNP